MAKKYKFNQESLSYDKINFSLGQKFLRILPYILSVIIIVVLSITTYTTLTGGSATNFKYENRQLLHRYELLSKQFDQISNSLAELQERDDKIYRELFDADPISPEIRNAGFGGSDRYSKYKNMDNAQLVIETSKKADILSKKLNIQSKSYEELMYYINNNDERMKSMPAIQPIDNKNLKRISSGFGKRFHPILKYWRMHEGIDFAAKRGTNVYVTGNGKIERLSNEMAGYGNYIVVDHGFGYKTLYAHLKQINVKKGQKVKRGDIIGLVGNTGLSYGPHLHYEVHKNGKPINPINYFFQDLTPQEFKVIIEIAANNGKSLD